MLEWLTLTMDLSALLFFDGYIRCGRRPNFARMALGLAVQTVVYVVLSYTWDAATFSVSMLLGLSACVIYDVFAKRRDSVEREVGFYIGGTAAFAVLDFAGDGVWSYAVYQAVVILCLAVTPLSISGEKKSQQSLSTDIYSGKTWINFIVSMLPCFVIIPEGLVLSVAGRPSAFSGLVISSLSVAEFAVLTQLQREIMRRVSAERMNSAYSRWQRESRDYMNTIRSQRHDFNLHLNAVSGLINSGEYEKCRQYVRALVAQANDINDIMPVSDPVVGSMLYNMREKAREKGTDIIYHITYDMSDTLCNGFECNKIIGNLLQNAIDAVHSEQDKDYGIKLNIFKRRGNTVIISENRFSGDPNSIARVFETGYSTKRGHEGIGLSMVLRTVERYGGRVYPEFEKDLIRFVVNIPNKVNLPDGGEIQ